MIKNHVVMMRGLPYDATADAVSNFFGSEFSIVDNGIVLPLDSTGRASGQAFVQFTNAEDVAKALKKNRESMGHRYVEIFESSTEDVVRSQEEKSQIKSRMMNDNVVRLRGLPYDASKEDVANFFGSEFDIVEDGILLPLDSDGRSSGQAFVQFTNSDDAAKALTKNRQNMGWRYIEVFESSMEDAFKNQNCLDEPRGGKAPSGRGGRGYGTRNSPYQLPTGCTYGRGYGPNGPGSMKRYGRDTNEGFGMKGAMGMGDLMGMNNSMGMNNPMGMGGTFGSMQMGSSLGMGALGGAQGGIIVRMKGIPFSATESEIAEWFSSVVDPLKVEIDYSPNGRPSGDALVLFANLQDAKKAMSKNKEHMQHRYVELVIEGGMPMNTGMMNTSGLGMPEGIGAGMMGTPIPFGASNLSGAGSGRGFGMGFGRGYGRGFGRGGMSSGFAGMSGIGGF